MNIFKETNDFIGSVDLEQENSLSSLFRLAKQIRMKLGNQGYLLDHYLSLFFDAVYNLPPLEAMDDGYQAAAPYYEICKIVCDPSIGTHENPLYNKTALSSIREIRIGSHSVIDTRQSLLYLIMADDYLSDAMRHFAEKQDAILNAAIDCIRLSQIYNYIVQKTGEATMDALNLKLKQKFFPAPQMAVFAQGFAYDIVDRLTLRDIESSKQMFQLILDEISV